MATAPNFCPPGEAPASPRQRLWRVLRWCHQPRSLGELFTAAEIEPELFFSLIDNWSARGLILTQVNPMRFLMTEAARSRVNPPPAIPSNPKSSVPKHSGRQRLWAAMRVLKEFDLPTVCMAAETGEKGALEFLNALTNTGFLRVLRCDHVGTTIYRLVRNTGPKHPVVRRRVNGTVTITEADDRNDGHRWTYELDLALGRDSARLGKSRFEDGGVS